MVKPILLDQFPQVQTGTPNEFAEEQGFGNFVGYDTLLHRLVLYIDRAIVTSFRETTDH